MMDELGELPAATETMSGQGLDSALSDWVILL